MNKIKKTLYLLFSFVLLAITSPDIINSAGFKTITTTLTTFSDGQTTATISFPPGGGLNSDATVTLPKYAADGSPTTIFSAKVDMVSASGVEIGTPYIWVPVSEGADKDHIKQISTEDCSIIESYPTGDNPSRTFVIPGGDVWVGNRDSGNVTKLSPLAGNQAAGGTCGDGKCGTDEDMYVCPTDCLGSVCGASGTLDCKKYKVVGNYATGSGPRGVTGGTDGNVWVGNAASANMTRVNPSTGAVTQTVGIGGYPYGAIGDPYGHIWNSNRGNATLQCLETASGAYTNAYNFPGMGPYGIGQDSSGNIYVAYYEAGSVLKFNAISSDTCPASGSLSPSATYDTGTVNGTRGVAVDQKGYVWVSNSGSNKFYVFTSPGNRYEVSPGTTNILGSAIDFKGFGWTASYDSGNVYKYSFDGASISLECSANVNGNPYNYSDMTGLRTIPKRLILNGMEVLTAGNTFNFAAELQAALNACTPDGMGDCVIPLNIFSMQGGKFLLKNLEIVYGMVVPITTGGLVPCGRSDDDIATPWVETNPCNPCAMILMVQLVIDFLIKISLGFALLAFVIAGFTYMLAGENSSRYTKAKQGVKYAIIGTVIILLSWTIVTTILTILGYISPLSGKWYMVTCPF